MKKVPIVRLAVRREGRMVNAYIASMNSMTDAVLVASIDLKFCVRDPDILQEWIDLIGRAFRRELEELGIKAEFETRPAPEHERGGTA